MTALSLKVRQGLKPEDAQVARFVEMGQFARRGVIAYGGLVVIPAGEVARLLGVSRRRVSELVASEAGFAGPTVGEGGYFVWPRESIDAWAASRSDGAPKYVPPICSVAEPRLFGSPELITPDLAEVFDLACEEARSLNHDGVTCDHLVLAFLRPNCPGAAGATLGSFGLTHGDARTAWTESMGDRFEPHDGDVAVAPATRFPFERAKLEALDLRDEHVSSEHLLLDLIDESPKRIVDRDLAECVLTPRVLSSPDLLWRVQSSKYPTQVLRQFFDPRGVGAAVVRDRVIALTEDATRQFEPLPEPPPAPKSPWAGPEPQLALSPLGHHPERRRPWGSGVFSSPESPGGIRRGRALLQYFIDRDGYPVLTTEGKPIHLLIDEDGNDVLDDDGYRQDAVIDVPPGSSAKAYRLEDWR